MLEFCPFEDPLYMPRVFVLFVFPWPGTETRTHRDTEHAANAAQHQPSCTYAHVFCKKFIGTPSVLWHLFQFRCGEGRTLLTTHTHAQTHTRTHTYIDVRPHVTVVSCLFICMRRTFCLCRRACGQAGADWDHFQMPFTLKPMRERVFHIFATTATAMATLVINATTLMAQKHSGGARKRIVGGLRGVEGQRLLPKVRCSGQSHALL